MIDYSLLKPVPDTAVVLAMFFGGPQDGFSMLVPTNELRGLFGRYELQGFRSGHSSQRDSAVYAWRDRTAT